MLGLAICIAMALLRKNKSQGVDLTLTSGATGCEVTKASIDKVVSSGIFAKADNFLLARVAFMSSFGKRDVVENGIGIWQTTPDNLKSAKGILKKWKDKQWDSKIKELLCVDFGKTEDRDLLVPLYSAICLMLLIQGHDSEPVPNRGKPEEQFHFWLKASSVSIGSYHDLVVRGFEFDVAVKVLDANKGESDTQCFVCQQSPTDLLVIMDESASLHSSEYSNQVKFVEKVMEQYKMSMDNGGSQLGLITFSEEPVLVIKYTSGYSYYLKRLRDHVNEEGSATVLHSVLQKAKEYIQTDKQSRLSDPNVRKLVFLLTDGKQQCTALESHERALCTPESIDQSAKSLHSLSGVTVYTVGMKSDANMEELQTMASDPSYARIYQSVDEFSADIVDIVYSTCQISLNYQSSSDYTIGAQDTNLPQKITVNKLTFGEKRTFQVQFSQGFETLIAFKTKKLELIIYASFRQSFPSEADHDFKIECKANKECILAVKNPENFAPKNCQTGDYGDSFHVTINAVGPESCKTATCVEDLDASMTTEQLIVEGDRSDSYDGNNSGAASQAENNENKEKQQGNGRNKNKKNGNKRGMNFGRIPVQSSEMWLAIAGVRLTSAVAFR